MTVLLMLLTFAAFLGFDFVRTRYAAGYASRVIGKGARMSQRGASTTYQTPGFEFVGAVAQDGGLPVENFFGEGI